ncbi:SDR family NAD(P)-dependent oxidoreductase [Melioribacteraceae bacterium 4301-Me]|uniref:SDR family NAD(P)-dependent oxidoreductase n=1 Tax=Pyranulibacter aquaticus TaxID=3163344 RepID=UPI00359B2E32
MIDLTNKVTLITGGSRGIGAACVEFFTKANSNVAFTYLHSKNKADELIKKFTKNNTVKAYKVDMQSEQEINDCVEQTVKDFGKIDILVHNAGIWNDGTLEKMTLKHWDELIRINLTSNFLFVKAVVPIMKKNNFGRIINVSSTAGQRGEAFHSHYAASKGGIISFTKSLAVELAPYNITVNSVAPGWVDTEMNNEVFADESFKEEIRKSIPVGRIATAEDIAGPILFLASDLARHINGEILNVNGGSVLCG